MKVWVIVEDYGCCDKGILIFSSEKLAKEYLRIEEENNSYFSMEEYTIIKHYVDSYEVIGL